MYKRCVTEQSAQRQRQLTAGLLEMMRKEHYEDITVSSFCEQMNIPRKSFYRYFSSKEGALYALLDNAVMDFQGEVFTDDANATQETLTRFFTYWKNLYTAYIIALGLLPLKIISPLHYLIM